MSFYFKLFILVFSFLCITPGECQFVFVDNFDQENPENIDRFITAARGIKDSLITLGVFPERFDLFEIGNDLYMTADGRFDVFQWKDSSWVNVYKGSYHGYNFNSQKFTYKNKLFSYRGYGFWREHGEIIEFLFEKGEWQMTLGTNQLPFGFGYMRDTVFSVYGSSCYTVDLIRQSVSKSHCSFDLGEEVPKGQVYNFKNYLLINSRLMDGSHNPIIDKRDGKVYLSRRQPFSELMNDQIKNALIHIHGDAMDIFFPNGEKVQYTVDDELRYYLLKSPETQKVNRWVYLMIIPVLLGLILLYRFKKSPQVNESEQDQLLLKFSNYTNTTIDADTLDRILEIDNISVYETKRYKRALLVRKINTISKSKHGNAFIVRKRDPSDKRFFLYQIQDL